jgi:transposase
VVLQLANLFATRNRLLGLSTALKLPLQEQSNFYKPDLQHVNVQSCKRSLIALKEDLSAIDQAIEELINSDERLKRLKQLITSVPCVGPVTATHMIICTNEFKDITDPRKFACYAGVAPFKKESGRITGRAKVSHAANKKTKSLLHICSMAALRSDKEFQNYFERKTKIEGKPGMAVVNAMRNKLILRIFACVNQDRLFIRDYIRLKGVIAGELIDA